MDGLEEGIVKRLNRDQKLRLMLRQVFGFLAPERALLVNGMDDGPSERQELDDAGVPASDT